MRAAPAHLNLRTGESQPQGARQGHSANWDVLERRIHLTHVATAIGVADRADQLRLGVHRQMGFKVSRRLPPTEHSETGVGIGGVCPGLWLGLELGSRFGCGGIGTAGCGQHGGLVLGVLRCLGFERALALTLHRRRQCRWQASMVAHNRGATSIAESMTGVPRVRQPAPP